MSLSSNSVEPYTAQSVAKSASARLPRTTGHAQASYNQASYDRTNQSPEQVTGPVPAQLFEMPLFPGYMKAVHSPAAKSQRQTQLPRSREIEALIRQQAEFSHYIREQSKQSQESIEGLQLQLQAQQKQHHTAMQQMTQTWTRQLTALNEATAAKVSASAIPAVERRMETEQRPQVKRARLSHIPTTYKVPRRTQVTWIEQLLGAVPAFVWLVVTGMAVAGMTAIALSPAGLWPSVSFFIRLAIPIVFVTGLLSLSITAVWDSFR